MTALYNEIDGYAAQWLRNLSDAGHIASGLVDERSIRELQPHDLEGATQAHFFAGIGVWSYALKLAGVSDSTRVWTGSCPCQPFSAAGKRRGVEDDRHLWPEWFRLIRECRPAIVLGEQVEGAAGGAWLDLVQADLEGIGYAFGAAVLPAAGVGAPHLRHRLYFVAYASGDEQRARWAGEARDGRDETRQQPARLRDAGVLGDASGAGSGRDAGAILGAQGKGEGEGRRSRRLADEPIASSATGELGDADDAGLSERERDGGVRREALGALQGEAAQRGGAAGALEHAEGEQARLSRLPRLAGATGGFWADAEWIACADGKARPVEPGTFPLAHGATSRVGRLRAYGNALCAEQAAAFIRAAGVADSR